MRCSACFGASWWLAAGLAVLAGTAAAQSFPSKLIRIISPYTTGLPPDTVARLLADKLARAWGHPVVVEPRPGANGFIALEAAKRAIADGHELVMADNGHIAINPALFKKLPYDVEQDFTPVALIYRTDFFVAVSTDGPYRKLADLIAAAKTNPGRIAYSTPFIGSPHHLGGALLEMLTGTKMLHVPFKGQWIEAIARGDVDWGFAPASGPLVRAGKVKLIAIAAKSRLPMLADIPTVAESGGPADYEVSAWVGLLAPKATAAETVSAISRAVSAALGEVDFRDRLAIYGFTPLPSSPREFGELIRADSLKYGELVRKTGATVD